MTNFREGGAFLALPHSCQPQKDPSWMELKNAVGADASEFAKKIDFDNLKSDVTKLDIDKFEKCTKCFKQF